MQKEVDDELQSKRRPYSVGFWLFGLAVILWFAANLTVRLSRLGQFSSVMEYGFKVLLSASIVLLVISVLKNIRLDSHPRFFRGAAKLSLIALGVFSLLVLLDRQRCGILSEVFGFPYILLFLVYFLGGLTTFIVSLAAWLLRRKNPRVAAVARDIMALGLIVFGTPYLSLYIFPACIRID